MDLERWSDGSREIRKFQEEIWKGTITELLGWNSELRGVCIYRYWEGTAKTMNGSMDIK